MSPFEIFDLITKVPRPSKHEEKIRQFLLDFAAEHSIEAFADKAGNVIMRKKSNRTNSQKNDNTVILQAHMDMVCEKNNDVRHDFMNDPIETYIEGDWMHARGTTLGADDGIGMAMALAVLTSPDIEHPDIECLFTIDEETGLTGANLLEDGLLHGKQLINLDSEDDGQIFIGCAGGIDTFATLQTPHEPIPDTYMLFKVGVKGLLGGHSGDDINKGRGNANKILTRFLFEVNKHTDLRLVSFNGGNLRNAIAREVEAEIAVTKSYKEQLRIDLNVFTATIEQEIGDVEKDMQLYLESIPHSDESQNLTPHSDEGQNLTPHSDEGQPQAIAKSVSDRLLLALYACPHGVKAMSKDMPGLVETSTNLASVKTFADHIEINTSQRSSVESAKHDIKNEVECALRLSGAWVSHGDGYPGWKPNVNSPLLETTKKAYQTITGGEQAEVKAIHAGLECGLFLQKYPYLDMVSIGPQLVGVHSPQEKMSVSSTRKTFRWLVEILKNL
ncbi:MAG: aminoacyl-histidine dipeptidase [Paludibacteraceae bacterium]|nr:aminoacyl-histidine dipeptidase [Paludibacteraceae bacterium]